MKETEINLKDEVKNIAEAPIEKQSKYVKTVLPQSGHKCFEYNVKENELRYAKMQMSIANISGEAMSRVDMKEDCVYITDRYITALNFKNATRHLKKIFQTDFIPLIVR